MQVQATIVVGWYNNNIPQKFFSSQKQLLNNFSLMWTYREMCVPMVLAVNRIKINIMIKSRSEEERNESRREKMLVNCM